jgi:hypothetical protein
MIMQHRVAYAVASVGPVNLALAGNPFWLSASKILKAFLLAE